jgi:hypothetical protein
VDSELTFKSISYGLVGLIWATALVLSLVSIRKENRYDQPLHGLFSFTLIVIGLCAFIALCSAYRTARSLQKVAPHVQTEIVKSDALPR